MVFRLRTFLKVIPIRYLRGREKSSLVCIKTFPVSLFPFVYRISKHSLKQLHTSVTLSEDFLSLMHIGHRNISIDPRYFLSELLLSVFFLCSIDNGNIASLRLVANCSYNLSWQIIPIAEALTKIWKN